MPAPSRRRATSNRKAAEPRYWIGVASHDHVIAAVRGGFIQLGHGKEAPVRRLARGDMVVLYSPRESMGTGATLRAFTAAGRIIDDAPFQAQQAQEFRPFRRRTVFLQGQPARIQSLLGNLTFTRGRAAWGILFRRSLFSIGAGDFATLAKAMQLDLGESAR